MCEGLEYSYTKMNQISPAFGSPPCTPAKANKMDHMDHSQMDHSMPMEDMCSMNMLLSWDYHNLCLFSSLWHIKTLPQFVLSLAAVSLMAFGYEYLRVKLTRKTPRGEFLSPLFSLSLLD